MSARGQSLVEMCLGLIVFVTILIFGIHFAEVGYLSIKVTEGAAHATWDATGMRAHRFAPGGSQFFHSNNMRKGFPARTAEELASAAYDDFDGRGGTNAGSTLSQVFTQAYAMEVSCRPSRLATFDGFVNNPGNIETVFTFPTFSGNRVDAQSCSGRAQLRAFNLPRRFLDEPASGFFKERHYDNTGITVCAIGRPSGVNGICRGRLQMALGDWGFAGITRNGQPAEWEECNPQNGCTNQNYWRAVERLYTANGMAGGTASSELAAMVSGSASPTDENTFHMAFRGEYNGYDTLGNPIKEMHHVVPSEQGVPVQWEVTPSRAGSNYEAAYNDRSQCFLGVDCGSGPF